MERLRRALNLWWVVAIGGAFFLFISSELSWRLWPIGFALLLTGLAIPTLDLLLLGVGIRLIKRGE